MRVVAVEGPQAADIVAFNTHDHREKVSAWLTRHLSGSFNRCDEDYTKLPAGRVMFRRLMDLQDLVWLSPARCNRMSPSVRR